MAETAEEATSKARDIVLLRESHRNLSIERGFGANELRLLDLLYERPLVNIALIARELDIAFGTAGRLVERLASLGLLDETTGYHRNRIFRYTPYWRLFTDDPVPADQAPIQVTSSDA